MEESIAYTYTHKKACISSLIYLTLLVFFLCVYYNTKIGAIRTNKLSFDKRGVCQSGTVFQRKNPVVLNKRTYIVKQKRGTLKIVSPPLL